MNYALKHGGGFVMLWDTFANSAIKVFDQSK